MELTKTVKVQIYTDVKQKELLLKSMKAYSCACNNVSEYVYSSKDLSQASIHKQTYDISRSEYGLPSQMACNVIRTVIASYKTNKSNGYGWIKCKYDKPQMTLSWNKDYSLKKDKVSIGTLSGRLILDYTKKGMGQYFSDEKYRFGAAKVVYKHGRFFLHIPVTYEVKDVSLENICNVVGHDRGIRFITTSYDSSGKTSFVSGKQIKQKRAHYKLIRRQLQQVKTPSSRRRLKAIGQRENRWMQDVNHCISKALVTSNPEGTLHVLEDLTGIRAVTERVKTKNRYMSVSWSYHDLEQKLIYKAAEHNQKVIKVSPKYTSQICPKCGHIEKGNRDKNNHVFCCKNCGYTSNDDRIGAMNLYRMGIEYLVESQSGKPDCEGCSQPPDDASSRKTNR